MTEHTLSRKRPLRLLLTSVIVLLVVWIVGSYWLLNSQWLQRYVSNIEGIEVTWEKGYSQHPGRWKVEGFFLSRTDSELSFSVYAESASLEISLLALFRGELNLRSLNAQGIRRLTLNDLLLEGFGDLYLEEAVFTPQHLEIAKLSINLNHGSLQRDTDHVILLRDIDLSTSVSLTRVEPMAMGADIMQALSGRLSLAAYADAWDVFNPYLHALPWIEVSGRGQLQGDLRITDGLLEGGSRLQLDSPELHVTVDDALLSTQNQIQRFSDNPELEQHLHHAEGSGMVRVEVTSEDVERLMFSVALNDVVLSDITPYAQHAELTFQSEFINKGVHQLDIPTQSVLTLHGQVIRLDMLDAYLASMLEGSGITLRGSGELDLELTVLGQALDSSRMIISAPQLHVRALGYDVRGDGTVSIESDKDQFSINAQLHRTSLHHHSRKLLEKAQFQLSATGPLDPQHALTKTRGEVGWKTAQLPDIAVLQPYLEYFFAEPLELISGRAISEAQLHIAEQKINGIVSLKGQRLETMLREHSIKSNAQLSLKIRDARLDGSFVDISGSQLSWDALQASQQIDRLISHLSLNTAQLYQRRGMRGGRFSLEGTVQRLAFLNSFLPDAHGLALQGNGSIQIQGGFEDTQLLPGTQLSIASEHLQVSFLDYVALGDGTLTANIESSEKAHLSLTVPEFTLTKRDDEQPHLQGHDLTITTHTDSFSNVLVSPKPEYFVTRIAMPDTRVSDFSRYNSFLPEDAGITLLGGTANVASEFELDGLNARGSVNLKASNVLMVLLDQRMQGDLHLNLRLEKGDLETRQFLAKNSFLRLDRVTRLSSDLEGDTDWWVQLNFDEARLRWSDQINLSSQLSLTMRDTGLLTRLFLASVRDRAWLNRLLDVNNVAGHAQLDIHDTQIRLSNVDLRGERLTLLADLTLHDNLSNGALYARLGTPAVGVELKNSEAELRIVRPRHWFDSWRVQHNTSP